MDEKARNDFRLQFGERVKNRRKQLDMTQEELTQILGYAHKTSISKIEKGKNEVPQSQVIKLADALRTTVEYLMGVTKSPDRVVTVVKKEEDFLIEAWHKATSDEKMQIYYVLKKYGMPEPKEQDTGSSESLLNENAG